MGIDGGGCDHVDDVVVAKRGEKVDVDDDDDGVEEDGLASAVAVHVGGLCAVEPRAPIGVQHGGVRVQAFGHFVANDVHKAVKHSLQKTQFMSVSQCHFQGGQKT